MCLCMCVGVHTHHYSYITPDFSWGMIWLPPLCIYLFFGEFFCKFRFYFHPSSTLVWPLRWWKLRLNLETHPPFPHQIFEQSRDLPGEHSQVQEARGDLVVVLGQVAVPQVLQHLDILLLVFDVSWKTRAKWEQMLASKKVTQTSVTCARELGGRLTCLVAVRAYNKTSMWDKLALVCSPPGGGARLTYRAVLLRGL